MPTHNDILPHIPRLRRYARALAGDSARADDLVQDTLERALSRFSLWPPRDLRPWLFAIMHNLFVSQVRRPQHLVYGEEDGDYADPLPSSPLDRLAIRDLDQALQALSEEQREVLLLVGLEELSYAETAKVLGIPQGTVMSRLSRARDRLRALMSGAETLRPLKVVK